jgi:hypothetical protein
LRDAAFPDIFPEMNQPRKTPVQTYRKRLAERKLRRVEVVVPEGKVSDIRAIARKFVETSHGQEDEKGSLVRLLRDPAVVGSDFIPAREFHPGRKIEL